MNEVDSDLIALLTKALSVKVECTYDDDGDQRVTVVLCVYDTEIDSASDYFDRTGAKS